MRGEVGYRQGMALVIVAAVLWSMNGLILRLIGDAGTWQVLFYRSLGMLPVLWMFFAAYSRRAPITAMRAAGWTGVIGGMGLVMAFAGAIFAIQSTTIANAVFLFAAAPLMSALLAWLLLGETVRPATWGAIALAVVGIFVMVRAGLAVGAGLGNTAALLSSAGFAIFTVTLRWGRLSDMLPAALIGSLLSIVISALVVGLRGESLVLPPMAIALAFGMGAISIGLGMALFTIGSRVVPAAEIGVLSMIEVLLAPVWVLVLRGETASTATWAGGAILLAAILFNTLSGAARKPLAPPV